jgi:hypothetical protein
MSKARQRERRKRLQPTANTGAPFRPEVPRRERIFANGVTLYCRWNEMTNREDIGIETDERGYRYLENMATQKGMTVDEFCREVLIDSFQGAGVKLDPARFSSSKQSQ